MKLKNLTIIVICAILIGSCFTYFNRNNIAIGSSYIAGTAPTFYLASSTAFTLTTTSQRLLATSSPTHRAAATVQPVNCTNPGPVFLNMNRDIAATANSGTAAYATTTLELKDYPNLPVVQGSVTGITAVGTCTVLITEWRLIQ